MDETCVLTADRGDAGRRVDLVLGRRLADRYAVTRTRVQRWIAEGLVSVNGIAVERAATRVAYRDLLAVALPAAARRQAVTAETAPIDLLFEDEWLLALDKPAGTVVHPTYQHRSGTILNRLAARAVSWPAGQRPSIVGRLDKETSGIVLVAKTAEAHAALQRTLTSRDAEKHYLAVVVGRVNVPRGVIDLRVGIDACDRRRMAASSDAGAPSETRFERLARTRSRASLPLSLLRCRLLTGRRHQIRVHLAARGWPIAGDPLYGSQNPRLFPRTALHAHRLAFTHPFTSRAMVLEAPLPDDLAELLSTSGLRTAP